jgi:hypothetical protein
MDKNWYVFLLQRVDLLLNFKFPFSENTVEDYEFLA